MTWASNSSGRSVPYRLQQACFRRDRWTCQRCGYTGRQTKGDLHADHKINRAAGGQDVLDNLQTLCTACHGPKTRAEAQAGRTRRKRTPRVHPADVLTPRGVTPRPDHTRPGWLRASGSVHCTRILGLVALVVVSDLLFSGLWVCPFSSRLVPL